MQKLMKNWVFTLIVCILLAILAVLMFLSGFKVGNLHIGEEILHIVAAVALTIYVIFALFPLVARYRGALQGFVVGEVIILLLTAVAHIIMNFGIKIPLLSSLDVCSVVGLALWLRGVVETVHAYLSNAHANTAKRIPLWQLLLYILLSAVGVWQLVKPLLKDEIFIFIIGTAAAVIAVIFGYATAMNRKATSAERMAKREKKAKEKAAARAEREKQEAARREAQEKAAAERSRIAAEKQRAEMEKLREKEEKQRAKLAAKQKTPVLPAPKENKKDD